MYHLPMQMSKSPGLRNRLIGAAAQKGRADAELWVQQNIWRIVSDEDWVEAYGYAENTKTRNVNQDTGDRDDVISEGMISSKIEELIAEDLAAAEVQ